MLKEGPTLVQNMAKTLSFTLVCLQGLKHIYLCMVRNVQAHIFTVADVAMLDSWTRPLAANTDR